MKEMLGFFTILGIAIAVALVDFLICIVMIYCSDLDIADTESTAILVATVNCIGFCAVSSILIYILINGGI